MARSNSKWDTNRAPELYASGMSVASIAAEVGVSAPTVHTYLRKEGLYAPAQTPVNDDALRRLHAEGLWDSERARQLGCSAHAVKRHREAMGLSPNIHIRTFEPSVPIDNDLAMTAYEKGLSDWDAGIELGVSVTAFLKWRQAQGLPPNRVRRWTDEMRHTAAQLWKKFSGTSTARPISAECAE